MVLSHIDSKGRTAVKCSHEASSIRKLAVQDTNGLFGYSGFAEANELPVDLSFFTPNCIVR